MYKNTILWSITLVSLQLGRQENSNYDTLDIFLSTISEQYSTKADVKDKPQVQQ